MTQQTYIKRGDLKPDLVYYASDLAEVVAERADLRDVVSWRLIAVSNGAPVFTDAAPTVTVPNGAEPWRVKLTHTWQTAETAVARRITVEAEAMWPGSKPQTFPVCVVDVKPDLG